MIQQNRIKIRSKSDIINIQDIEFTFNLFLQCLIHSIQIDSQTISTMIPKIKLLFDLLQLKFVPASFRVRPLLLLLMFRFAELQV